MNDKSQNINSRFGIDWTLLGAVALMLCSLFCILALLLAESDALEVAIEPDVIDLGSVAEGKHEVGFELVNNSVFAVDTHAILTTCTCSKVELPVGAIGPEGRMRGSLVWDLGGRVGPVSAAFMVECSTHGRSNNLNSSSTGPSLFQVVGVLRAHVKPWWRVEPPHLTFTTPREGHGEMLSADRLEQTITVQPVEEEEVRVVSASISGEMFQATVNQWRSLNSTATLAPIDL